MNGMKREHIETMISQEVERIISGTALELVDVEYVREKTGTSAYLSTKKGASIWRTVRLSVKS